MVIKKVLNSSVVLASDERGEEFIVLSKGIGYGHRPGDSVVVREDSRIFVPRDKRERQDLLRLIEEIPVTYLEVTQEIVQYAQECLNTTLNPHIYGWGCAEGEIFECAQLLVLPALSFHRRFLQEPAVKLFQAVGGEGLDGNITASGEDVVVDAVAAAGQRALRINRLRRLRGVNWHRQNPN